MKTKTKTALLIAACALNLFTNAAELTNTPAVKVITAGFITQPLSLADALNIAEKQNAGILKAKKDLEANHGVVIQTRAILIPKVQAKGNYQLVDKESIETIPFPGAPNPGDQNWSTSVQLVQSIYEGGRMKSAVRTARLTRQQALLQYQTTLADLLLNVQIAYHDVLLADKQIVVQEASIELLNRELEETKARFEAGTVPQFNVLRAEVELANAKPRLFRARNAFRISKQILINLMGYDLPREVGEDIPMTLTGTLEERPYEINISEAVQNALRNRTELSALRSAEQLRAEGVVNAKSGYKPSIQGYGGYGSRNSQFYDDLGRDVSGWFVGAQMTWNLFDGLQTQGRVKEAKALQEKAQLETTDATRRIDLEVRTAYSNFTEAREVLCSQKKVLEQADEAIRLAKARSAAGTGTQLDILSTQTALTEARTTQILALHDYMVALARLERAIGLPVTKM